MEEILGKALEADKLIIYGAHLVALECARWLIQKGRQESIIGFAVTDTAGNPSELLEFPVKRIEEYKSMDDHPVVIIAMPEKYHTMVEEHGRQIGFCKFIKIGLEYMSKIKGLRLLAEQMNYPHLSFLLRENKRDISWLDMIERRSIANESKLEQEYHYKFPTLFYLDEKKIFEEVSDFDFYKDYEKVCGKYRNLHMLPIKKTNAAVTRNVADIISIYAVFSVWDSAKVKCGQYDTWIYPVQVGCKLTNQRYGKLFDNIGTNISEKNGSFAELTGAYWIWKNRKTSKYKGLCHYRRHFVISEKEIRALDCNDIDVLLTTPRYVPGGIKNMFIAETPVKEKVYQAMILAISQLSPDDKTNFEEYMNSVFYYPNNMVIARNHIYDDYCEWMFPILFYMEKIDLETNYGHETDRHIAYAAELLTSFYFVKNRNQYRIAVTDYQLLF